MQTVYPTGTTIYKPEKCYNGYILLTKSSASKSGTVMVDMNGNEVRVWEGYEGFPNRILPGGHLMTSSRPYIGGHQGMGDLVQLDWDGNIVWKFDKWEEVDELVMNPERGPGKPPHVPTGEKIWVARQHHDWQREGNPCGYFVPGMEPYTDKGKTLILGHQKYVDENIHSNELMEDVLYEVTWEGEIVWKWVFAEHFDELGFSDAAKKAIKSTKAPRVDWMHINCASYLGPNRLYDQGDERFHPDNIIWDSRNANILGIIDRKTGKIVWRIGPDYDASPEMEALGWIVGVHHTHMIPKGLPGEGNIMCYDNGGIAGYGEPGPMNLAKGHGQQLNCRRDYSRVIEFDPVTLEKVWEYSPQAIGRFMWESFREYSPYISAAQRLPNGNTLITEGALGRIFQVTPDLEIVWEFISPYCFMMGSPPGSPPLKKESHMVYRGYLVPFEWIPQLEKPKAEEVIPPENKQFRISGSGENFKIHVV